MARHTKCILKDLTFRTGLESHVKYVLADLTHVNLGLSGIRTCVHRGENYHNACQEFYECAPNVNKCDILFQLVTLHKFKHGISEPSFFLLFRSWHRRTSIWGYFSSLDKFALFLRFRPPSSSSGTFPCWPIRRSISPTPYTSLNVVQCSLAAIISSRGVFWLDSTSRGTTSCSVDCLHCPKSMMRAPQRVAPSTSNTLSVFISWWSRLHRCMCHTPSTISSAMLSHSPCVSFRGRSPCRASVRDNGLAVSSFPRNSDTSARWLFWITTPWTRGKDGWLLSNCITWPSRMVASWLPSKMDL